MGGGDSMSDETAACKGSIPVEEKIKMYGNRAKLEAERIRDANSIRNLNRMMHKTGEYKRYALAKKLADLKYDRKIEELRQRAGSMIDATEGYEKARSFLRMSQRAGAKIDVMEDYKVDGYEEPDLFMKMPHSFGFKNLDSCVDTFKKDSQRYKQQLDEAERANSDEYRAFFEYNDLVAKKNAEISVQEGNYKKLYNNNRAVSGIVYDHDWCQRFDQWFDEIAESERRLAENPDDAYAQMKIHSIETRINRMAHGGEDLFGYESWYRYFDYRNEIRNQQKELVKKGYDPDEIRQASDDIDAVVENIASNVKKGNLPVGILENNMRQYETANGEKVFAVKVPGDYEVKTAWGDTYDSNGEGGVIVSASPDFTDAVLETSEKFGSGKYKETDDADSFDAAISKAASTTVSVDTDKSFVDGLLDSLTNRKDSGASDMDGRSERDRKSDDDKYETFKDKDGNQCRRDRTTGETTVWVEGYDRMRNGKVEHVKSYWKVVRPRG